MTKKMKRASRMAMQNRVGKKRNRVATYAYVETEHGVKRVPANRIAQRQEKAIRAGAPGRSIIQALRQKRKARLVAARHRAKKQQREQRSFNQK